ncbi:hypothetical protein ACROYT_G011204 [Oculina patagonica]
MCSAVNLPASLKLLSDGHQRVKGKEANQNPPGEELQNDDDDDDDDDEDDDDDDDNDGDDESSPCLIKLLVKLD